MSKQNSSFILENSCPVKDDNKSYHIEENVINKANNTALESFGVDVVNILEIKTEIDDRSTDTQNSVSIIEDSFFIKSEMNIKKELLTCLNNDDSNETCIENITVNNDKSNNIIINTLNACVDIKTENDCKNINIQNSVLDIENGFSVKVEDDSFSNTNSSLLCSSYEENTSFQNNENNQSYVEVFNKIEQMSSKYCNIFKENNFEVKTEFDYKINNFGTSKNDLKSNQKDVKKHDTIQLNVNLPAMALTNYKIEDLLRGDISDIEELEDDEIEMEDEEIAQFENLGNFINRVNVDIENMENENDEILIREDESILQNLINIHVETVNENVSDDEKEEIEEINDRSLPNWQEVTWENQYHPLKLNLLTNPIDLLTPLAYFKKLFDNNIIDNIVRQTNLYSTQKSGHCVNTHHSEIEQLIGIHLMMSLHKKPRYRMFWAQNSRDPNIANTMARNRFEKLRSFLHFNDNTQCLPFNDLNHDKLFKIRPFIDRLRENFKSIPLEEFLVIDEVIIPFKGKSVMKQYNKAKPHKWGIKLFALASKCGIIHDFEVYIGNGTLKSTTGLGLSGDIVLRLSQIIPKHKNFKLYFGNWYTSYNLMADLKYNGILAIGTVRSNRMAGCTFKNDKDLRISGRGSYDCKVDKNNGIIACKWLNTKIVHLFSNYVGPESTDNVNHWSNIQKKKVVIQRPNVVKEYNAFMGGIDLHDMLVEIYRIKIKCKRYYLRIIFHLIDMCVVNSWLMYRRDCKELKISKVDPLVIFKNDIALGLLMSGKDKMKKRGTVTNITRSQKKYKISPKPTNDIRFDCYDHWPESLTKKKRCKLCIKSYTTTSCSKCQVSLCYNGNKNCFREYHKK